MKELDIFDHIAAIPVLRDSAHQQGHPVQVIRSSCHVATLQYTVRLRVISSNVNDTKTEAETFRYRS